ATFGGPAPSGRPFVVALICPDKHEVFDQELTVAESASESVQSVAQASGPIEAPPWLQAERAEWLKNSASTARSFAQTMLSMSLGAIPVYFAVVNYVASHHRQVSASLGVIPPVLFI